MGACSGSLAWKVAVVEPPSCCETSRTLTLAADLLSPSLCAPMLAVSDRCNLLAAVMCGDALVCLIQAVPQPLKLELELELAGSASGHCNATSSMHRTCSTESNSCTYVACSCSHSAMMCSTLSPAADAATYM